MIKTEPDNINKYKETEKPNAIIFLPRYDYNKIFENKYSIDFYKKIKENYDLLLTFSRSDKEIMSKLENMNNPELIIFSGHGNIKGTNLTLDQYKTKFKSKILKKDFPNFINEEYGEHLIDANDFNLKIKLRNIENPTVFFYSCNSGKYLATNFSVFCPNLNIIAGKESFGLQNVTIKNYYPLDLSIKIRGKNITYKKESSLNKKWTNYQIQK